MEASQWETLVLVKLLPTATSTVLQQLFNEDTCPLDVSIKRKFKYIF